MLRIEGRLRTFPSRLFIFSFEATVNSNTFRFALIFFVAQKDRISVEDFRNAHEYLYLRPIRELKTCEIFEIKNDCVQLTVPLKVTLFFLIH